MSEIKVTRMTTAQAFSLARRDRVLRYDRYLGARFQPKAMDSFQFRDGRYAYKAYDSEKDCEYYAVIEGLSEKIKSEMDEADHQWLLNERNKEEHESFVSIEGSQHEEDVDEDISSPFSQKSYNDWYAREMANDIDKEAPMDPKEEIVRMFVAMLPENERLLFKLCFDSSMTTEEIMDELNIPSKQALSNRKERFLEKLRKVFRAAGYEVPTAMELRAEKKASKG